MFAPFPRCTKSNPISMLKLSHGLSFPDLYRRDGLLRLDAAFVRMLETSDRALCRRLIEARADPHALAEKPESELLIALAPHVDETRGRRKRHKHATFLERRHTQTGHTR